MTLSANAFDSNPFNEQLPSWVFLQLLEHCNLRCSMCFEWGDSGSYRQKHELKMLDIHVIKSIIKECESARPHYDLFGGEPLIYPQIDEVLEAIAHSGSKVQFPTNGVLLEKMAETLVATCPQRIWVSLDGPPEINDAQRGSGVFDKAVRGIDRLYALRTKHGQATPQIGISMCITPANHRFIASCFFNALDINKIDCISIELQAYMESRNHRDYESVLQKEFGVLTAPIAKGFVCDPEAFAEMDYKLIEVQIASIKDYCQKSGKYLNLYPREMTEENIHKYFTANWHAIYGARKRCPFPWISVEISARGDVTTCHAFYDLSLGNVYDSKIGDIWRGEKYRKYRDYLRKNLFPICHACSLFYNEKPPGSELVSVQRSTGVNSQ